ncbi:conserved hypothetical protein [Vibrio jasicida]|uniref:Uncharacterized protein n=4 Tax=Vibrio TaxID=662 RepID=A0AAU9QJD8_9VIBR|nr:conserved hypothetical protein [Vibrio jasicida]CAH1596191.1 conserved hypothetical protein [Vibrio jasicida]
MMMKQYVEYEQSTNTVTIDGKKRHLASPIFFVVRKDRVGALVLDLLRKEKLIRPTTTEVVVR